MWQGCGGDSYSKTGYFSINFREEVDSKELYPYEGELPAISMKQSLEVKHNEYQLLSVSMKDQHKIMHYCIATNAHSCLKPLANECMRSIVKQPNPCANHEVCVPFEHSLKKKFLKPF